MLFKENKSHFPNFIFIVDQLPKYNTIPENMWNKISNNCVGTKIGDFL